MAFGSVGSIGATNSSTANQTSADLTLTADANAGNLVVLLIGVDNHDTGDGDTTAVTDVTNSGTANTWTKLKEWTFGQGSAQAGATVSMWYSIIGTTIASGGTITANFSNATSRDKSAMTVSEYTIGAGNTVAIEGTPATYAGSAISMSFDVTTANIECLRIVAQATEDNATTVLQTSTGTWDFNFTAATTTGGGGAANIGIRGMSGISTGTGSQFTFLSGQNGDSAGIYVALKEVTPPVQPAFTQTTQYRKGALMVG